MGMAGGFYLRHAVAVVGIILRRNMLDIPAEEHGPSPVLTAFRFHYREVLRVLVLNMAPAATYYILFVYAATWVVRADSLSRSAALNITSLSILTFLMIAPIAAWLSDQIGRKFMMIVGMSCCLFLSYPLTWLMHQTREIEIAAGQMIFAALLALYMASIPAAMCEMFPHSVRVSAVSVGYGLAYALFGGTAPAIAVWLIGRSGNDLAFAWYLAALTAVSLAIACTTQDRHGEPLD